MDPSGTNVEDVAKHNELFIIEDDVRIIDRAKIQIEREILLVKHRWKILLICVLYQYVHNTLHNLAYYLHVQRPILRDLGFELLSPKIPESAEWISELFTFGTLLPCLLFAISPLYYPYKRRLYTITLIERFIVCVCVCETLRVISFIVTILPSPAEHCLPGSTEYDPPSIGEVFYRFDVFKSCGDLIFSGHTTYTLTAVLAVTYYCRNRYLIASLWCTSIVMAFLIIGTRKHYTVDIVIAWYVIPMVWVLLTHYYHDTYPPELFELLRAQKRRANSQQHMIEDSENIRIRTSVVMGDLDKNDNNV